MGKVHFDTNDDQPWVFWYWMYASVSKEGITADLEAMKEAGLAGAYMMPILGELDPPVYEPTALQLSPEWWGMVEHAIKEAGRLGLELGIHASDGFAVAGGPWIKPEQSMQKLVWSETVVNGGKQFNDTLPQPPTIEGYYRDIAIIAIPNLGGEPVSSFNLNPSVISENAENVAFLGIDQTEEKFKSDDPVWIQFEFDDPFTCRSVRPTGPSSNLQWQRLTMLASQDGEQFDTVAQMKPARQGWQNWDEGSTFSVPPTTARYFRFAYNPEGTEPGSEDLDAGKWKAKLVVQNIELMNSPKIHQIEGKSGLVWRISDRTSESQIPKSLCTSQNQVILLTDSLDENGVLNWNVPDGSWTVLRMGHTSTGHTNYTGGGGLGLECDKFSKEAVALQFKNWFGAIQQKAGSELAREVITRFHVDSWECGSQNWSSTFAEEFLTRRGYEITPYLPVLAGIPLESPEVSERFLYDFRETISELYIENFYQTLSELAHNNGVQFSAENVSPTMLSDGVRHFAEVDLPIGEFWLRSPTHDKPNDMLDAISGGHIYGKKIIPAEAFTQLRMDWDEHPASLKALGDYQYTLGINRFVYHVFAHNPWMDRKPGMTLNGVGLYFQRDQTWWKPGRAMVDYATRCQALLQNGIPVRDIAVFIGEELPRRSMLPDRLVRILPGLYDQELRERESTRLRNEGTPTMKQPANVTLTANMAVNFPWVDPLNGYQYDSFNPHALMTLAHIEKGRVVFAEGSGYGILVIPQNTLMNPEGQRMSVAVASKLLKLIEEGATVYFQGEMDQTLGLKGSDKELDAVMNQIFGGKFSQLGGSLKMKALGQGKVLTGKFDIASLEPIGINRDFVAMDQNGKQVEEISWTHRKDKGFDLYFLSNQTEEVREIYASVNLEGYQPEIYDPVVDELIEARDWKVIEGRIELPLRLEPNGSLFLIFSKAGEPTRSKGKNWKDFTEVMQLQESWQVQFDTADFGPKGVFDFDRLISWTEHEIFDIRYFSGTATYQTTFEFDKKKGDARYWLNLGEVGNIAEVKVNGVQCAIAWTPPYQVEITDALKAGINDLIVEVTNTWQNRLIGDQELPEEERVTFTPRAPYLLEGRPLIRSGLLGPVSILKED
ncbi:glycosyl hydrolase [Marinoscillum sp. MHG1-6]|uniref:glycosyl hydrolase n=1 Tax=Marinoscillum sp. MHG1-6 TaxID=2959627 RepID=UPI002157C99B|nr:glycosyl hydrolase [Marinoscillum sp. MHG1-6]